MHISELTNWIVAHEPIVRLSAFFGVFGAMALWELVAERRHLRAPKGSRWVANISLVVVNTLVLRLFSPIAAMGIAAIAAERGWGLLNNVTIPYPVAVVASVIVLDLAIYLQHVMFHAIPALWRLHMVHHADVDFDVTTGSRFHTIEIVLSMGIKMAAVAVLGTPVIAVLIFEVLLNATAMFNHANVRLPRVVDRVLRWIVVTPDMHRVHHSVKSRECNRNFGFNLPWWDRLLGTYRDQPAEGHEQMQIGVTHIQEIRQPLHWLLALPFVGSTGGYPINRPDLEPGDESPRPETETR